MKRRTLFDPLRSSKAQAAVKRDGREVSATFGFWFRRKYNLTPKDPRYLEMTAAEIEADYWAHHFYEKPASEAGEDEDYDNLSIPSIEDQSQWEDIVRG